MGAHPRGRTRFSLQRRAGPCGSVRCTREHPTDSLRCGCSNLDMDSFSRADVGPFSRALKYWARGILSSRAGVEPLLAELGLTSVVASALGVAVFAIDATFLDKRSGANWAVAAHQDVIVPIPAAAPANAIRNERARHGVRYDEPRTRCCKNSSAVRIHFDHAGAESGGIAIVEGSHAGGRLSDPIFGASRRKPSPASPRSHPGADDPRD
jgi:hypothetical protein